MRYGRHVGIWRTLTRWREAPTAERNDTAVVFSHDIPTPIDDLVSRASTDLSDTPVPRERALTVPAVLRGRNVMCSIATLPLVVSRDRDGVRDRPPLLKQIDRDVPNVTTLAQTVEDLVFEGIAWWHVEARSRDGRPVRARHVDARTVSINPPMGAWPRQYLPSGEPVGGTVVWVDGRPVPAVDMVRFDSPNPGVATAGARAIRRALVFERAAVLYANDPRPNDYFTPTDAADPIDDDEVEKILADWQAARRRRATAYVPEALEYHTVANPSPAELQLADMQKQAVVDIANAFGLDSEDMQVSTTSRTYANAVDRRRDRINDVLSPYMRAITDRLSMDDVTRRGYSVVWDLDDYLRADPMTRWSTYETGLRNSVLSVGEVREMEGLPAVPVEGPAPQPARGRGDAADQQGGPDQQEGASMSHRGRVLFDTAERDTVALTFTADDPDDDTTAVFEVSRESRTVTGLLVPWNKTAGDHYGISKWRFDRDSLTWSDVSRVKLNRDHMRSEAVGVATDLTSTRRGLRGTFKVARGEEGDKVLSLAEDKVLDGFSIEAAFDRMPVDDESGTTRVTADQPARLVGVAITPAPAFDDARVSRVNATREGITMGRQGEPQAQHTTGQAAAAAPGDTGTADPSAAGGVATIDTAAFTSAVESFTDAVQRLADTQDRPPEVDPTRRTASFDVREEPLYRFDGIGGKHDFSSDMIAGSKGDSEALERVQQWVAAHFVQTSDVSSINPDRQRPDMYVDELNYATPIWDSIAKGAIGDNTPFVVPKFGSASGLVSDHTEGTEPTAGSFGTTSQTITPTPVSGKVEITRETWDQGGNPQLSTILWRQVVRAYNEALESAAAALLEGLTVTTITLTAGATDTELDADITAAMAALQFVRGGHRFRDLKINESLYKALASAVDSNGRKLYPMIAPENATGTAETYWGALNVGGVIGRPAWALTTSETAAADSFLFNREDVHGWASNPNRLQFEHRVSHVDIGVWGYKALACTRTDGVRAISYDPDASV